MEERIREILTKYHPNPKEAVWKHKQSGQWIAKHKDLEIVAAAAGVVFNTPTVLQFDLEKKVAAFVISGTMDKRTEWSVGEATAYNSQNQYYGSMAEKRGKDRVILKLIGLHGYVYSDNEIEEEEHNAKKPDTPSKVSKAPKVEKAVIDTPKETPDDLANRLMLGFTDRKTVDEVTKLEAQGSMKSARAGLFKLNPNLAMKVDEHIKKRKLDLATSLPSPSQAAAT